MSPDRPCPSQELLRRSLDPDSTMTEPERQSIEAHVNRCDRGCKAAIERLLLSDTLAADPDTTRSRDVPSASAAERPVPTIPGYELLGELGRGGMGVVYKARDVALNRLVALKMILAGAHAGADDLARFRTEAEAVAALQHPHVVQIYEIGAQDGCPYLSLELVEGGSLAGKLAGQPQPPRWAAELIETLARAVHFAHQQGFIHRDLKPANVLLAADGTPKITDFGLAKKLGDQAGQTQSGAIVGTPSYMAPEQMARTGATPVGTPADVYALGAILYECLTGRPPFVAATAWDLLTQVVSAEPAPPRRLRPKVPADLETICLKCLHKEPQRRYGSAEALADDLRRFLTGRPIQARPVGVIERSVKWLRRNTVAATLAVVVTLATLGGVGGWLWSVQDRAARQAEADRQDAARRSAAQQKADIALARAKDYENQAADLEREADKRGREEPQTPEAAKQAVQWRRQAEATLDEAEQALADVPGTEALRERLAQRRQTIAVQRGQAEKIADLLAALEKARAAQPTARSGRLHFEASARAYAAAVAAFGLEVSRPDAEPAAAIQQVRPGVRMALILALDDWASCIRLDAADAAKRLSAIADGADTDAWRRQYRAAAGEIDRLRQLAEEAPRFHLPTVSLIILERDLYARGEVAAAVALLRAARRQNPRDFWVYNDLATSLIDPEHPNPATVDEAESCACAAVALRPGTAIARFNLGLVFDHRGDLTGAAESYNKAIELDPTYSVPHNNLGNVLKDQGNLAGAAESYRKAIELDPTIATAHCNLGIVLRMLGDRDGAIKCFNQAIGLDPKDAPSYLGLGTVLYDQGDKDGAAKYYRKAIELDATDAIAHYNLGNVLYEQGNRDGAAEHYNQTIKLRPDYAPAHNKLGEVRHDQGDLEAAAQCFREVVKLDSTDAVAHNNLGYTLRDLGDLTGADAALRKAIELDRKFDLPHYNRGLVCFDQGNREAAADCFGQPIELNPQLVQAHFNLGMVLLSQGKFAEAKERFGHCLKLLTLMSPLYRLTLNKLWHCERLLTLEKKLPAILKGEQQPANSDRLGLATVCQAQGRYAAAARFCRDAFADDRKLADDLDAADRYNGACYAARAGCSQGADTKDLDDTAHAGWRKQALDWLRADLALWQKRLDSGKVEDRRAVRLQMHRWQAVSALAGLRDAAALAKLAADEQNAWRKFWKDVQALLDK